MAFEQEPLGYNYDALEPHFDAKTMEIHYSKHHAGYVKKLNAAVEGTEWEKKDIEELIKNLKEVPENIRTAVRNNGGGHFNHSMFWKVLKKDVAFEGEVAEAITKKWGSFEKFKEEFSATSMSVFGSGWGWLVVSNGELEIVKTANQDNPLTEGKIPVLGVDMWEHAAYLRYQNRKAEYLDAFFNIINWQTANDLYKKAIQG